MYDLQDDLDRGTALVDEIDAGRKGNRRLAAQERQVASQCPADVVYGYFLGMVGAKVQTSVGGPGAEAVVRRGLGQLRPCGDTVQAEALQQGLGGGVGHDIALEGSQGNLILQLEAAAVVAEDVYVSHLHIVRGQIALEEEHARVERLGGAGGLDGVVGAVLVEVGPVVIEAQRICLRAFAGDQHGVTFVEHIQVVGLRRLPSLIGGVGISGTRIAGGSRVASQFAGSIGRYRGSPPLVAVGEDAGEADRSECHHAVIGEPDLPAVQQLEIVHVLNVVTFYLSYRKDTLLGDAQPLVLHALVEGRLLVDHDPDGWDVAQSRVACLLVGMGGGEGAEVGLLRVVGAVALLFQERAHIL